MKFLQYFIIFVSFILSASIYANDGEYRKKIIENKYRNEVKKYDVLTEDNKKYIVTFKGSNNPWRKSVLLSLADKSTVGIGDGRYTRTSPSIFLFKFDDDNDKAYKFTSTNYDLQTIHANINKATNKEFLNKLSSKNVAFIKVTIAGIVHTFRINLKDSK